MSHIHSFELWLLPNVNVGPAEGSASRHPKRWRAQCYSHSLARPVLFAVLYNVARLWRSPRLLVNFPVYGILWRHKGHRAFLIDMSALLLDRSLGWTKVVESVIELIKGKSVLLFFSHVLRAALEESWEACKKHARSVRVRAYAHGLFAESPCEFTHTCACLSFLAGNCVSLICVRGLHILLRRCPYAHEATFMSRTPAHGSVAH